MRFRRLRRLRRAALAGLLLVLETGRAVETQAGSLPGEPSSTTEPTDGRSASMATSRLPSSALSPIHAISVQGLDLGPTAIRSAVAAADGGVATGRSGAGFGVFDANANQRGRIDRKFQDATIESCGGEGAYKFDPPKLGPISLGGWLALPFLIHAVATGRCRPTLQSPFADRPAGGR